MMLPVPRLIILSPTRISVAVVVQNKESYSINNRSEIEHTANIKNREMDNSKE